MFRNLLQADYIVNLNLSETWFLHYCGDISIPLKFADDPGDYTLNA